MIKIVFLDIDGTVLSHKTGSVPSSAIEAISAVRKKGVLVFGCTGRSISELQKLPLQDLEFDGWITLNGGYNYDSDGVISECPIATEDLAILVEELKKTPFPVQFMEKDSIFMNMHSDYVRECLAAIHTEMDPIQDIERVFTNKIYMIVPWAHDSIRIPIEKKMTHMQFVRWNQYASDGFAKNCGKSFGVHSVLLKYGLHTDEAMAVGDGENDMDMFAAAGTKLAMGNSVQELKAAADDVTDDIDCGGLKKALEKYVLNAWE